MPQRIAVHALAALSLAGASARPLAAQDSTRALRGDTTVVVDRVLAVVGNRPVLASQVDEELFSRQAQGVKLPETQEGPDAARRREFISRRSLTRSCWCSRRCGTRRSR